MKLFTLGTVCIYSCGNVNFARRVECNKCGAPAPSGTGGDRGGGGGRDSGRSYESSRYDGGSRSSGGGSSMGVEVVVLMFRVLHLLWRLFHPTMVLAVTLLHPWGMEWKQFPRLQAMLVVHLRMVVPQGVMAVMHRALVVGVVATMVIVLLDARNLAMEMHLLKKSSSATRIVIMPEYISIIYLQM